MTTIGSSTKPPGSKPPVKTFRYVPRETPQEKRAKLLVRAAMAATLLALLVALAMIIMASESKSR